MKRLTNTHWRNDDPWELCGLGSDCNRKCVQDAQACPVALKLRRLAAYEDAEEQGLLMNMEENKNVLDLLDYSVGICLEIQDSPLFGGEGATGYTRFGIEHCQIDKLTEDFVHRQMKALAPLLRVPVEKLRLISYAEYEEATEEDGD